MNRAGKDAPGVLSNEHVGSAASTNRTDASAAGFAKRMELFSRTKRLPGSGACPSWIAAKCNFDRARNMDDDHQGAPLARALSRGAGTLSDKVGSGVRWRSSFHRYIRLNRKHRTGRGGAK
jgi:hypothetical protein